MSKARNIVLIGAGNVGTQLGRALQNTSHQVRQVFSRTAERAQTLADPLDTISTSDLEKISQEADLYIIAVKDDAIAEVCENLDLPGKIVVHTSGWVERSVLDAVSEKNAVLYPFQTLSRERTMDFENVPLFIETENKSVRKELEQLTKELGSLSTVVKQKQRQTLHLAGVWANNFPNHLWGVAHQLLEEENLSIDHLLPLIRETAGKLEELPPQKAQTGPAIRNDQQTISKHLQKLCHQPEWQELYRTITNSIQADNADLPTAQQGYLQKMKEITTFVFDLDGVLTDGMGIVTAESEVLRKLNSKDAFALQLACRQDYQVAVISGSTPTGVPPRLERLGIESIYTQSADKVKVFQQYLEHHDIDAENVLFMGDDIPDLSLFDWVGVSTCPNNAADELIGRADYVSDREGGKGAARDVIETVMKLQDKWWCDDIHVW